jgi:uncharacterized protein
MDIQSILQTRRDDILRLATQHGASNVRVFGSVVRGESGPDSDIDLLVEFDDDRSLMDHVALIQDLEDLLGCPVDVVTDNSLHWYIRDCILDEAAAL